MTLITFYSLFFDDIRVLVLHPDADDICYGVTTACMLFFIIEIILASLVKEEYFLSFFFWLDLVSTISMITDIGWLYNAMTGGDQGAANAG